MDPLELAVLVTRRRGTPVTLVIIGPLVTLPFVVKDSPDPVPPNLLDRRRLCNTIGSPLPPGILTFMVVPFGTGVLTWTLGAVRPSPTLLERLMTPSIPIFTLGRSLQWAMAGL